MRFLRSIFFLFLSVAFSSSALDYSDMEVIFRASQTPSAEKILGFWVGRCIHRADPLREWPAFFEFGRLEDSSVHWGRYTQSHTWFNEQTTKYDSYSVDDLLKDSQCKKWLDNEQWKPVAYQDGSLVNEYTYPNASVVRASRLYNDGIREHIVLAYSKQNQSSVFPESFCYFNVRLEASASNNFKLKTRAPKR